MQLEALISGARMVQRLDQLAAIGGLPSGGMNRLPLTAEDREARGLFVRWLSDLGLAVRMDGAGNIIGRREGTVAGAPVVMTGSHLDTQPNGGRYDGIAGVVAALEVLEAMREAGFSHRHSIEIVDWTCEEAGGRFNLSQPGSRAMVGALAQQDLQSRCRLTGLTLREAMQSIGIDTSILAAAERPPGSIKAVVELHIEQGSYLEDDGKQVGVVTAISWIERMSCELRGQQAHAGGMPMRGRRDALCGAAELVLAAESIALSSSDPPVVATVGHMEYEPKAVPIVPGWAKLTVDLRCADQETAKIHMDRVKEAAVEIARRRRLELEWGPAWEQPGAMLAPEIVRLVAGSCEELDISYKLMASGGGHDTMNLARRFPAGMIFVPSVGGISHAPEEYTRPEDLEAGARVLCRTLSKLAI